jgi:hypothetical protein
LINQARCEVQTKEQGQNLSHAFDLQCFGHDEHIVTLDNWCDAALLDEVSRHAQKA